MNEMTAPIPAIEQINLEHQLANSKAAEAVQHTPNWPRRSSMGKCRPAAAVRETRREQKKEELKEIAAQEAVAPTGLFDVIVIDPPWPSRLARIRRLLCADVRL